LRFTPVTIPQGATITTAYLTFRANMTAATPGGGRIYGQAADNPPTFTTFGEYDSRVWTSANVHWTPAAWVIDTNYTSPDIKTVIQEIVNRPGWASGNALVLRIVADISHDTYAYSYDNVPSYAPTLHIEYTVP
jgi:hypothetical protein